MNRKRLGAATAAAFLLIGGGTAAYAYWTTTGTGSGTATNGTTAGVTIVQPALSNLVPGVTQALAGTFTNPNTFPVYVGQVTVSVDPAWSSGTCDAADYALVQPTATNAEVAVDDSTTWSGGSITLINKAAENQDDCKTVAVPLLYSSN